MGLANPEQAGGFESRATRRGQFYQRVHESRPRPLFERAGVRGQAPVCGRSETHGAP